jgi:hypothetical protein
MAVKELIQDPISSDYGARVWHNGRVPVVFKRPRQSLLVRVPYQKNNRDWLLANGRSIEWKAQFKAWAVPRSRFEEVVRLCLGVYGQTYVIQAYRPLEKCAPACCNAVGYDCECSCLGKNHGSERELSHVVSETFAFERGERKLALRLLTQKGAAEARWGRNNVRR